MSSHTHQYLCSTELSSDASTVVNADVDELAVPSIIEATAGSSSEDESGGGGGGDGGHTASGCAQVEVPEHVISCQSASGLVLHAPAQSGCQLACPQQPVATVVPVVPSPLELRTQ